MPDRPDGGVRLGDRPAGRYQKPARAGESRHGSPFMPWLVALVALSLVVNVLYSRYLFADSFYDLYSGRYILQHGIPHWNVVTVQSHGAPWIDQQWLAHVLYYGAWAVGGYPALAVMSAVLVTSGFAVMALLMQSRGIPPTRMFVWLAAAFIGYLGNILIRAQSFAYPLFALTLWLIVADSRAPRLRARTWLVVLVLVIWANTHGSVLVGAAMVALYGGYRAAAALRGDRRPFLGYLALSAAAAASVVCTPYGAGVIGYYEQVDSVTPALTRYVVEWERPSPLYLVSMGFYALVVATVIAVVVAWRRGRRPDPLLAVIALAMLALALTAIRNQTWFGFTGSLLAADTLARSSVGRVPALSRAFSRATAAVLAAAALVSVGLVAAAPDSTFEVLVPVRAIDAAAALAASHPAAHVLGDEWSSAMLWRYPAMFGRVAFDARLEQYSVDQLDAYAEFLFARTRGWQRILSGYDIVVVSRHNHQWLASALQRMPGWRVVFSGRDGLVLERSPTRRPGLRRGFRRSLPAGCRAGDCAVSNYLERLGVIRLAVARPVGRR
jgi:hypothetical protein